MPRIAEVTAPTRAISAPSEGFSAFEVAGRRVGPFYRQTGQDTAEIGKLKAQKLADLGRWPFEILSLAKNEAAKRGNVGVNVKLKGGDRRTPESYRVFNEINTGAPFMADFANQLANGPKFNSETDYNPDYGAAVYSGPNAMGSAKYVSPNQDAIDAAQQWYLGGMGDPALAAQQQQYMQNTIKGGQPTPVPGLGNMGGGDVYIRATPQGTGQQLVDSSGNPTTPNSGWWSGITNTLSSMFGGSGNTAPSDSGASSYDTGNMGPNY